jgi:hypothetical protein
MDIINKMQKIFRFLKFSVSGKNQKVKIQFDYNVTLIFYLFNLFIYNNIRILVASRIALFISRISNNRNMASYLPTSGEPE